MTTQPMTVTELHDRLLDLCAEDDWYARWLKARQLRLALAPLLPATPTSDERERAA